jgi:hypothetical protein
MSVSEFRVISDEKSTRKRERWLRLLFWGAAFTLSGVTLFAVYGADSASPQVKTALAWLAGVIVGGTVIGAQFVAYRQGLGRIRKAVAFELTDKDLVRRSSGWPDVRIGLPEIRALYEHPGGLVVESVEPTRRIAIPARVEGFAALRAELAKHSSVIVTRGRSVAGFTFLVIEFICWVVVLWSKNSRAQALAAAVALMVLAWESLRLIRMMGGKPKRFLVWIAVGISWAAAILLVYERFARR